MNELIVLKKLAYYTLLMISSLSLFAQVSVENFNTFSPIQITDIDNGKAFVDYEDIWLIDKNTGKWVIPVYSRKDAYIKHPGLPDADNYLTRADGVERGRGFVYVFNNTKRKVKTLENMSFDYFHKSIRDVEKNLTYRIWGLEDPENDGWNNRYMVGFGGFGKYSDNNVTSWSNKEDLNIQEIVGRENIPVSNEWTTYTLNKDFDVSNYDWIFISFGHSFQIKQNGEITQLVGFDNIKIPGSIE